MTVPLRSLLLLVACTAACPRKDSPRPITPPATAESRDASALARGTPDASPASAECENDVQCVLVDEGCCGCNQGGRRIAIATRRQAAHQAAKRCQDVLCAQVISNDPTCRPGVRAACSGGRCVIAGRD